jgi:hypothetical protein
MHAHRGMPASPKHRTFVEQAIGVAHRWRETSFAKMYDAKLKKWTSIEPVPFAENLLKRHSRNACELAR